MVVVLSTYSTRVQPPTPSNVVVCSRDPDTADAAAVSGTREAWTPSPVVCEAYRPRLAAAGINDRPWYVLVAGEASGVHKGGPTSFLGTHVSICHVGRVFSELEPLVGRDRIIVIAQLSEVSEWMDNAVATAESAKQKDLWEGRRDEFLISCSALLDAGVDYDGKDVNPHTLLRVLKGERDGSGRRVVDTSRPGQRIFLGIYSHGNHPASSPQDASVKGVLEPSVVTNNELWYAFFPYEADVDLRAMHNPVLRLDGSGYADIDEIDKAYGLAHDYPNSLLHWQYMFEAYRFLFEERSVASVVTINQYCKSGGVDLFMTNPHYEKKYKVSRWPLFSVHTSGAAQSSLGDMWTCWFEAMFDASNRDRSLGDVYNAALRQYWKSNDVADELNKGYSPDDREFFGMGEVGAAEGGGIGAVRLGAVLGLPPARPNGGVHSTGHSLYTGDAWGAANVSTPRVRRRGVGPAAPRYTTFNVVGGPVTGPVYAPGPGGVVYSPNSGGVYSPASGSGSPYDSSPFSTGSSPGGVRSSPRLPAAVYASPPLVVRRGGPRRGSPRRPLRAMQHRVHIHNALPLTRTTARLAATNTTSTTAAATVTPQTRSSSATTTTTTAASGGGSAVSTGPSPVFAPRLARRGNSPLTPPAFIQPPSPVWGGAPVPPRRGWYSPMLPGRGGGGGGGFGGGGGRGGSGPRHGYHGAHHRTSHRGYGYRGRSPPGYIWYSPSGW